MIRPHIVPTAIALLVASVMAAEADHGENFHCDRIPFLHERAVNAIDQLSHNKTMAVIVKEYAKLWEVREIKRTCEAAAAGKSADFTCMQGRRDWDEIRAMIPEELFGRDTTSLRPHQLELQKKYAETRPHEQAYKFCEGLGVIDR